jgi:phage shock protein PspC (stress-responsive transcriptional regulator)
MTRDDTHAVPARQPLRRASGDRLLLGVCSGIARTLDVPPLAVRICAIVLAAIAFPLVAAGYVIAAAIVPRDDGRVLLGGVPADRRETLVGWSLIGLVLLSFVSAEFRLEDLVWPALSSFGIFAAAVATLALLALQQRRAAAPAMAAAPPPAPSEPTEAPAPPAEPQSEPPTEKQPVPPPPPRPRGVSLGVIGAAALLIAAAIAFLLVATGAIDPDATDVAVGLAVAAALTGAGAVAGAVLQRRGAITLVVLGLLLAGASAGVGLVADELDDGVGWRTERPASAADIPDEYRLGVGALDVDLRDTDLPAGATTVRAQVRAGELTVLVPRGVRVTSIGPTEVSGVAAVNRELPKPDPKPAGKRKQRKQQQAAPVTTIRIDADVRDGDADVVVGGR